ncbi:hypothetical protein G6F46_009304 [Rhizopus delemar]|uniref:Alpha/beta hydrolase fold-3 domain-containing protein n=3 Tax=Rhizopus TaxID=4842 RepID=I1CNT2_RHIO9|nr:hypothetical protein RO3G_14823 [Rhizopus delemar RA 99-880]KAG1453145.1 hypothetical protein G6F55_008298 [Rhizopus delemar]KAG1538971.1 hypothetical protein G6F51_009435 [Rhizopus arrhizus]KAG1493182.1 hypothetical protein G6F54_008765 [Rhizopus delemar]KAG1507201.1 hypothetical protein G6F53_009127 [Rhizopus delemar]|eukprot:EIE90112.1 hypothetical protein RO3G_14823 [Rhizopus delemar RA 99-880]
MSIFQRIKSWITVIVFTFAFTFPKATYIQKVIDYLQIIFFRQRSDWIHEESRGYWIAEDLKYNTKKEAIADRIMEANVIFFWIPGGGFRFDPSRLYVPTFANWIRALEAEKGVKSMMFVANYRRGRGHLFPSAIKEIAETYNWLIHTLQIDPSKIIIGADDAGVAVALDTLMLKIPSDLKPTAMICASPYTGLEAGGDSWRNNLGKDFLTEKSIEHMENNYIKPEQENEDEDDYTIPVSKYEDDLSPFSYLNSTVPMGSFLPNRMLIFLGGQEVLLDEGGSLASKAREGGIQVVVAQEPTGIHLWSMLPDVLCKEDYVKQNSIDRLVEFVAGILRK